MSKAIISRSVVAIGQQPIWPTQMNTNRLRVTRTRETCMGGYDDTSMMIRGYAKSVYCTYKLKRGLRCTVRPKWRICPTFYCTVRSCRVECSALHKVAHFWRLAEQQPLARGEYQCESLSADLSEWRAMKRQ